MLRFLMGLGFAAVVTVAGTAGLAQAAVLEQEYRLENYPSTAPACHQLARDLGDRLTSTYNVTVVSARCLLNESGHGVDLSVVFTSEDFLPLISTFNTEGFGSQGWYATEADCNAALPGEREHFTRATGLAVFSSVCLADEYPFGSLWTARVDGFGSTTVLPRFEDVPLYGTPIDYTNTTFAAWIKSLLIDRGYDMRHVQIDGTGGIEHLRLSFYGERPAFLNTVTLAVLERNEQCKAELAHVPAAADPADESVLAKFCVQKFAGGADLQGLALHVLTYKFSYSAEQFNTYAECAAARANTVDVYRSQGLEILGGLCSRIVTRTGDIGRWAVSLIEPQPLPSLDDENF